MEIIDILKNAREVLATRGVARNGEFFDSTNNCFCAIGAVEVAAGLRNPEDGAWLYGADEQEDLAWDLRIDAATALKDTMDDLLEQRPTPYRLQRYNIPRFNDMSETDQEVLDLFDRTIARLSA